MNRKMDSQKNMNVTGTQFNRQTTRVANETPGSKTDTDQIIKPEEWYNIPPVIKTAIERVIDLQ